MNVRTALRRGFDALQRYPALLLFPLLWDVAQIGLHYWGVAAGPGWPAIQLGDLPAPNAIRPFVPSPLPTVADLSVPTAPLLQAPPALDAPFRLLLSLIGVPLAGALVTALFLGLLADAVVGRPLNWRGAVRNWPTFAALALGARWLPEMLPGSMLQLLMVGAAVLFALLPFAVGVLGLPLVPALRAAPGLLWGRIGTWIGLALAAMLMMFTERTLWAWATLDRPAFLALLCYPAMAAGLVAAAAALCLEPHEPATRTAHPAWWLPVVVVTVGGAALGAHWLSAWDRWLPSREAALAVNAEPWWMSGWQRHAVLRVIPQPEGELVVSRINGDALAVAALRRGRFGWQLMSSETWRSGRSGGEPGVGTVAIQPDGGGREYQPQVLIVGELFDNRVAYLQFGKERFPVGQDGPVFVIYPGPYLPNSPFVWLDANGQPVPAREVKRP